MKKNIGRLFISILVVCLPSGLLGVVALAKAPAAGSQAYFQVFGN